MEPGSYLVEGLGHCGTCHSSKNAIGGDKDGHFLAGNNLQGWVAPDITNRNHTGIGKWTEAEIVQYLKTGANRYDIASGPMAEAVEHSTQHWRDDDLLAVAVYLKDLGVEEQPIPRPVDASSARMQAGKAIYEDRCSACYVSNGEGITHLFPRLANAPLVNSADPSSIIRVVLSGSRAGETHEAPTAPSMPAFAWNMTDQNVADVATYIRNTWGNSASTVEPADVGAMRTQLSNH
ncbi:c-type cytochrome [Pseudomonas helleri]|uniref:c-type cytochrome n=1 Tax=Pseudomonas helleri TaxID=1608996 RepID=UPI00333EE1E6